MLFRSVPNISMIFGVDPYVEHTDYGVTRSQEDMDKYLKIAEENLEAYKDRYTLVKYSSAEAAAGFDDDTFDFVLIDGDHSYEGVKADLNAYYPKLKKGGHIFVHDCFRDEIVKAIHEYREENRIRIPLNMSKNYVNFWVKS